MTVATQANIVSYLGDDVADTFPFTFPVYDADHLTVYLQDTTTNALVLLNTSDYSVTGINNENGGSVVTDDPVSSDNRIIIARLLPFTQDLDVLNQGGFYPANVERELDLIEMHAQQLNEEQNRSVRGPINVKTGVADEWPELAPSPERAGKLLGFTDDADAYPTTDTDDLLFNLLSAILVAGPGISITVGSGTITITNTSPGGGAEQDCWLLEDATGGGGGSSGDAEFVRDTIFAALLGVGGTWTQNDPGDTITFTVDAAVSIEQVYDAIAASVTAGTGIIKATDDGANTTTLSADPEFIRDTIGTAIVGGVGIDSVVDDAGNTITINSKADILTVVSAASVTPTFAYNQVNVTAQAAGLTIANPTGTAVDGHGILIRIKDNGTSRAIAWGTDFRVFDDALPVATTISKTLYIGVVYNAADSKWDVLGVREEA